ncbi:histidine ammonia-lyase [Acididesulfobacillus acetoxydans]|uniref:Histidine ammonia-lyase n=1 Tax=Acididesulfobacillus acetoxydans TaxID=1561005 RepID=A0A8S0WEK6_9FIRM|nr:histidine ammonia-lyase [Acididesulfobacillus acetoxydans]CAA7600222.1 histidine ammonia-lyase [Acididesulfobacillus acetoxydans]CEJ09600.1 Histidine ammonia-lyase [Acididesulfobacillus acetoxydans]
MGSHIKKVITIGQGKLTLEDVVAVARYRSKVRLSQLAKESMQKSRDYVDRILRENRVVYGLTTGFGKFSDTLISREDSKTLQWNLIRSHACGVGEPLADEIVRAIILLRVNALSLGYSGIRPQTVETLAAMLNHGVTPVIPEKGSLGASGDLAPLAHLALVVVGEGEAFYGGERLPGGEAMRRAGIATVVLEAKEGLALINGTQVMTAIAALAIWDALNLADWADGAAALTFEALRGIKDALDPETHALRPHPGQMAVAEHLKKLTAGSQLLTFQGEERVQDAYSLRCVPQVHGASRDALVYIAEKVRLEMNSVTDNPLIFADRDRVISGGNFHGQPMALAMDFLSISAAELADISERRLERLVNPQLNEKLPPFLTEHGGMNSGFMIAQYAAASLVSENKSLAHPASVDSIPSSGNQEDHVSMGTIAARKAREIVRNAYYVLAIELLAAAQAADFRGAQSLGEGTRWIYDRCREQVSFVAEDRVLSADFEKFAAFMRETQLPVDLLQGQHQAPQKLGRV